MPIIKITFTKDGYKCERCLHEWCPRANILDINLNLPLRCPKCNSPYWNRKRRKDDRKE